MKSKKKGGNKAKKVWCIYKEFDFQTGIQELPDLEI